MPSIKDITGENLKAQINEYHVLVAEVLGGMSAEITSHSNRMDEMEKLLLKMSEQLEGLHQANRLLLKEVMSLRGCQDEES